jgi:hypothetical protein
LVPDVEIPNDLGRRLELDLGGLLVTTSFAPDSLGQGPIDLDTMAVLITAIAGDLHPRWKVDINGEAGHGFSVIRAVS